MKSSVRQKEVREAILDATDLLLSRYGYKKMTIDDLAREVGIGKGSVYLHFSSKEEIALSHIDRIIEQLKGKLSAIAKSGEPADERIRKMLCARVLHRFESVQHYTQNINDLLAAIRPKFLARREQYFREEARIFVSVIEEGQREKKFSDGDALALAETLITATNSLLPFSLTVHELGAPEEIEDKTERLSDLLLQGLCRR
jgi:AcrR family transcriptional regulator